MSPHLQEGLKGGSRKLQGCQFYSIPWESWGTPSPGGYHKSNEAHDWEKPAGIDQRHFMLDKPDHLTTQCHIQLMWDEQWTFCLRGFQYVFPETPSEEMDALGSRQMVHAVDRALAAQTQPEDGGK